ncbi:MAG: hypothetical protein H7A26_00145 [Spirochaetales bacterium]|nr:hypothetical protein [Spirochaetales bacterium]
MKRYFFLCISLLILFSSCNDGESSILKKEVLFTLNYGKMEDQLDMSYNSSITVPFPAIIKMANGIVYIMNGNLKKIMKFTSFGDILTVLGNRETISSPVIVDDNVSDNEKVNRKAVFFPFNSIEEFAVDKRQYIYVSDVLPQERHEYDEETGAMLSNIIYRFDNNSNFIDSIGQDGKGGIPFPFIKNIITNDSNDIIAVTRPGIKHFVYWFDNSGNPLYRIEVDENTVPFPDGEKNLFPSVSTIKAPDKGRFLFIKTDYYKQVSSEISDTKTDIDFYKSYINILDVESGKYVNMIEIPDAFTAPDIKGNFIEKRLQVLYNFLDVVNNKYIILSSFLNNNAMQVLVLDTDGKVIDQTRINIDFESYFHIDINLSNEGILTALMAGKNETTIAWWRTDSMLQEK